VRPRLQSGRVGTDRSCSFLSRAAWASGRPLNSSVRRPVHAQQFRLGLADGAYGPGDVPPLIVTLRQTVRGPNLRNWQPESIVAALDAPIEWRGELVSYVTLSPRYTTDTLSSIRSRGGVVAVGRVLPGHDPLGWTTLIPSALHNWGVGTLGALSV
jgi:hypothetical protein